MYQKWLKYTAVEVKTGTDENGNRLLSQFAADYKSVFNNDICPNCKSFNTNYQKFLTHTKTMEKVNNSGYVLKKKYENIPLKFGSSIYLNNQNLTDKHAKTLLENHPRGKDLFDVIPTGTQTDVVSDEVKSLVDDNTKAELVVLAESLGLEDVSGNKTEIATLIVEKQSEQ